MKNYSTFLHRTDPADLNPNPEITGYQLVLEWMDQGYKHQSLVGRPYTLNEEAAARKDARKLNKEHADMIGRYKVYPCNVQAVTVDFVRLLKKSP